MACLARLSADGSHGLVDRALTTLENMEHRGAEGADADSGDGAGIMIQVPDALLRERVGFQLPPAGTYGVGMCFLPRDDDERRRHQHLLEEAAEERGLRVLGWRDVPVDDNSVGERALARAPRIRQLFLAAPEGLGDQQALERRLYVVRRVAEHRSDGELIVPSLSARTVVYKGMLTAGQLRGFYPELDDERCRSSMALVHSRFSTNTLPSWQLAHPFRLIAHNGEFNTLVGNRNWMRARQAQLSSEVLGEDLNDVLPVLQEGVSDSASLDNALELLVRSGRSIPHALMMLIPEVYRGRQDMPEQLRDFYAYHANLIEPWDGPASVSFCDGRVIGARLDRNGLRPGRWFITDDGLVAVASEAGAVPVDQARVTRKGRLRPGRLFLADVATGTVSADGEAELQVARRRPYGDWQTAQAVRLGELPAAAAGARDPGEDRGARRRAFGYTREDLDLLLAPMAQRGKEPNGSMGDDAPLAVLSEHHPPLFDYFKQRFAQVTNPAIDPVREDLVMELMVALGGRGNLLEESPRHARRVWLEQPILRDDELARLEAHDELVARRLDATWPAADGSAGLAPALDRLREQALAGVDNGARLLIISDQRVGPERVPVPSLLATGAVHHHLVRAGRRLETSLVVSSDEPREVHHMACLLGYGAAAVNPSLMLATVGELAVSDDVDVPVGPDEARQRTIDALDKGLKKILSKMGISTLASYQGAQVFEAIGVAPEVVDRCFAGTPSRIGGVDLQVLAGEALARHARGYPDPDAVPDDDRGRLPVGGRFAWTREGEVHMWNPDTVALLQQATRDGIDRDAYREYARAVNEHAARKATLRGQLELREADQPLDLGEVEPVEDIVPRFVTGGMSLGSLSPEAHETLAVAMNELGARSNTGEGGEDPRRFTPDADGRLRRSSIKQVASGRFGVTTSYLRNADELQIKIAQGSKPGEGGQLPGRKVNRYIAWLRHSTPGVELISPPPHHDIYSIEDLKQLIYDLRCANPQARVSVKLVAEAGVGTVAAGVAKAHADHIVVSGHSGGTGSSPLSSIKSAGVPWELGVAETQHVLAENDLRSRIILQTDGQMKTGRDAVIAGLLGADEVGMSTAPLIAAGCIMMRVCHLNTCPVGVATQDHELRERFAGDPEEVINFFRLVAGEIRELMARLGVRRFEDLIGRTDLLRPASPGDGKAASMNLDFLLADPPVGDPVAEGAKLRHSRPQRPLIDDAYGHRLVEDAAAAVRDGQPLRLERTINNSDRAVGGLVSSAITDRHGPKGLPESTLEVVFTGSAGQSFGAWLVGGVDFTLFGEVNDYAGKGLSGGRIAVRPPPTATFDAEDNVIAGNVALYGATGGQAFFRGRAGERFAVRNSGARAVVEGVGDHGCEYMTGGRVVVIGPTGRNFAAGMSGGIAYVWDRDGGFEDRCNQELVDLESLDDEAAEEVRELVVEHAERTGSPVAADVLERWRRVRGEFVKVMPTDYRRAIEEGTADPTGERGEPPDERPVASAEPADAPEVDAGTAGTPQPVAGAVDGA